MKNAPNNIGIMDKPPEPSPDEQAKQSLTRIKNKIMVMSGKGGVGKSSVSVNLAIALAGKGFKVGLMDVDIHGPDIPRMLGLMGMMASNSNRKLEPMRFSDNLSAVSIESLMPDKDDAVIWRGPMKHGVIRQFIGEVEWGDLDYLIIDSPPGTGDEPLTVAQLIKDARAVIVTTPQESRPGGCEKIDQFLPDRQDGHPRSGGEYERLHLPPLRRICRHLRLRGRRTHGGAGRTETAGSDSLRSEYRQMRGRRHLLPGAVCRRPGNPGFWGNRSTDIRCRPTLMDDGRR
jgi:cellulose biosynthesis protein BcsQ